MAKGEGARRKRRRCAFLATHSLVVLISTIWRLLWTLLRFIARLLPLLPPEELQREKA